MPRPATPTTRRSGRAARSFARIAIAAAALQVAACDDEAAAPGAAGTAVAATSIDEADIVSAVAAVEHYLAAEDLASAEAVGAALVRRAPRDLRAREVLGRVLLARAMEGGGDDPAAALGRAYEHYAVAAELDPRLHQNAGSIAAMIDRPDDALRHYAAAERHRPDDPQAPLYAAQTLLSLGRAAEAEAALRRALAVAPEEPLVHASLAVAALEQGRPDEAVSHVEAARALAPDDLGLRIQAARVYRRTGAPRRGAELLIGLDEQDRVTAPVASELAASLRALGEHRRAADVWRRRYEAAPGDPESWRSALEAAADLIDAGDRDEAGVWLRRARLANPDAPELAELERRLRG